MPEKPGIDDNQIQVFLREKYGLAEAGLEWLHLGNDPHSWVYRVTGQDEASYFLKLKRGPLNQASYLIAGFLNRQGLTTILSPLPTRDGELWVQQGEFNLLLYPFIEGNNGWEIGMTDRHWRDLGVALKSVHATELPAHLQTLLRPEQFDTTDYLWLNQFDENLPQAKTPPQQAFLDSWMAHRPVIRAIMNQLLRLAAILKTQAGPLVLCHADLHPGNILIDRQDSIHLIDWDEVMTAPRERDFIFVDTENLDNSFFTGYGKTEIDWIALTYYRCERVIQDVIVYAQQVFLRPELDEASQAEELRWFNIVFGPGSESEAALACGKHLPPDLAFSL